MSDKEDEPLHSSDSEFLHPKKIIKHNSLGNLSNLRSVHSGTSKHVQGQINMSLEKNPTNQSYFQNSHLSRSPSEKSVTDHGSVTEPYQKAKSGPVYEKYNISVASDNQMSSTFSTTEYLENLGENPLDMLMLTLEARLEIPPEQESFVQELAKRYQMVGAQTFFWTKPPKFFISPDVESYTKGTDSGCIIIGKSLFAMTMKKLNEKPNEWKKKYLPVSFGKEDNEARLIVATEVRRILKQERNLFKKKIMKNIIVRDGNPEQQIPRLIELAKLVSDIDMEKMYPPTDQEVEEEISNIENNSYSKSVDNSGDD
ncbi:hypothetical protein PPACK8108_LOCUS8710 [Phakopsora pachyrhizi]|uniref:Uncharacterized protein n=1 Tax=Phakopsora pachyrhizi TaxID=170000 RepID=A0AAV0AX51_PHAPC|nr:hypothetical protein PPACK8108_LOCUS8710 [Phakopsora pachyrhizi]